MPTLFLLEDIMKFKNTYLLEEAVTEQVEVFNENDLENQKYADMRIPGIVSTEKGVLVCYYEMRRSNYGDWCNIDLGMKVSFNFGQSWSERKIIRSSANQCTLNNPVMIAENEKLHLLYCEDYHRVFYRTSLDYGDTWSEDVELTEVFKNEYPDYKWTVIAMGPGHGTVLKNGRFLLPIWMALDENDPKAHWPSVCSTIYSDDNGKTWHAGEIIPCEGIDNPNESCLCELEDGTVYYNARNFVYGGISSNKRAIALSQSGISDWTNLKLDDNLINHFNPECCIMGFNSLFL